MQASVASVKVSVYDLTLRKRLGDKDTQVHLTLCCFRTTCHNWWDHEFYSQPENPGEERLSCSATNEEVHFVKTKWRFSNDLVKVWTSNRDVWHPQKPSNVAGNSFAKLWGNDFSTQGHFVIFVYYNLFDDLQSEPNMQKKESNIENK